MVKIIEGREVEAKVGMTVEHQTGRFAELLSCDWDGAEFRFPHAFDWNPPVAVDVEITGRTFIKRAGGEYWVRVSIIFVGDGEPSTSVPGWLKVNPFDCPYTEPREIKDYTV